MLCLTRKVNEGIWIGESRVVVLEIRSGGKVRLGIEANKAIPIVRDELVKKDTQEPSNE
jgi:carbon storage regulator CsrA